MLTVALTFLATLLGVEPTPIHRVFPAPLDFYGEASPFFLSGIHQIESDGKRLYFRSARDAHILITDFQGKILGALGGEGGHPSEFGDHGVLAMAVTGDTVSGIGMGARFIRFYRDGAYHSHLRLASYNARAAHATSNVYAFSQDHVVVPALEGGHLATAYHRNGKEQRLVGSFLEIGKEAERVALNATLWCYRDGFWYAAHKFFPLVSVYDQQFALVRQFQIHHDRTERYINYLADFQPNEHFNRARPLVSDFKFYRDSLYLMVQGDLFQVNPQTGTIYSITHFIGKGEDFGQADGKKITLPLFALTGDGRIFAAHPAMLWQHDFWHARLPASAPIR